MAYAVRYKHNTAGNQSGEKHKEIAMQAVITNAPATLHPSITSVPVTPAKDSSAEEVVGYALVSGRKPARLDGPKFANIVANYPWEERWMKQAGAMTPAEYTVSMNRDRGMITMAQQHAGTDADLEELMLLAISTTLFSEGVL